MSSEDRNYLRHILDCIERIDEYTRDGKEAFDAQRIIQDAVVRNIEVIGEAVKNLSAEAKAKHPSVPWRLIARMRDKMIHHYFGLDLALVWEVVAQHLKPLKATVRLMNEELDQKGDFAGPQS